MRHPWGGPFLWSPNNWGQLQHLKRAAGGGSLARNRGGTSQGHNADSALMRSPVEHRHPVTDQPVLCDLSHAAAAARCGISQVAPTGLARRPRSSHPANSSPRDGQFVRDVRVYLTAESRISTTSWTPR
jgi:hypothetical protein